MDVAPPLMAESTSGELRLARMFKNGAQQQKIEFSIRGRTVEREFGGDAITDLGIIALNNQARFDEPVLALMLQSRDITRQLDFGLTFEERRQDIGSFAVGVLNDHYRRKVRVSPATVDTNDANPWLLSLRSEIDRGHGLAFYGSFVQGLEDSALAPVSAANRNEPPPATRTWQVDAGIRWVPSERLQLILGAFDIHKPYFNVGADNVYRLLGRVQHRGLESSLSFNDAGLTVLVGGVLLKPRVERAIPEPGATGNTPLGPTPLTLTANIDYAPPRWGPWAASLQWNRLSSRVATTDNADYLSPLATLGAGIRYRWALLARPWSIRLDGFNLTDARGLHVSNLDLVLPEQGRRYTLTLATDL